MLQISLRYSTFKWYNMKYSVHLSSRHWLHQHKRFCGSSHSGLGPILCLFILVFVLWCRLKTCGVSRVQTLSRDLWSDLDSRYPFEKTVNKWCNRSPSYQNILISSCSYCSCSLSPLKGNINLQQIPKINFGVRARYFIWKKPQFS